MQKLIFIPPPFIALALIGMAFVLDRGFGRITFAHLPGGGFVLMAAGFFLAASALLNFRQYRTTFLPHGDPSALVMLGPYGWTRNPMYLGLATVLLGVACYFGSLSLFFMPPAFFLIIDRIHIPYEEARLSTLFGGAYEEYRRRVDRWL